MKDGDLAYFSIQYFLDQGYTMDEIKKMMEELLKNSEVYRKDEMRMLSDDELDDDIKFHNKLYESSALLGGGYKDIRSSLEKKNPKTAVDYFRLSEIYSFEGDYQKAKKFEALACKQDKQYCQKNQIEITGKVVDENGQALEGVKVIQLATGKSTLTNQQGEYKLNVDLVKLRKERISFEKQGYSSTFVGVTNVNNNQKKINIAVVQMNKAPFYFHLNNKKMTIDKDGKIENGKFVLGSFRSKYYIPKNAFVDKNEKPYYGDIYAYVFEFDKDNAPSSLLSLDSFSQDRDFLGTEMITYGMPYIIFRTKDGERIDVKKDNPMVLVTKVDYLKQVFESLKVSEHEKVGMLINSKAKKRFYTREIINKTYLPLIAF